MPAQVFCNDPQHQILAQQIYKRGLELLEEKKHTENLLYNISEAVIAITQDYKISLLNKAAEELLNVTVDQAEGKKLDTILSLATESSKNVEPEEYCFKASDITLQNLIHEAAEGKKYLKLQSTTVKNPRREDECIITLTDVTREKMLEKSKDEFISIASHELRTPMTVIKSYLWMLENGKAGQLSEKQRGYLAKASGGVERMLSMINDTLNTSKIDQGKIQLKIEEVNVKEFMDDFYPDFKLKASEKGLNFSVSICENCKFVFCDRGKLREMLTNLVGNSIKFTSTGEVRVIVTAVNDAFSKFEVSDTGKGIDPADIKRLFQKFGRIDNSFQTVAEAGGTGLGLYIVKNLVETMGGTVGVVSEGIGKGSTFWFTLPTKYYEIPEVLRENSVLTLAPVIETQVSSICPI